MLTREKTPSIDLGAVTHLLLGLYTVTLGSIICFHNYLNSL